MIYGSATGTLLDDWIVLGEDKDVFKNKLKVRHKLGSNKYNYIFLSIVLFDDNGRNAMHYTKKGDVFQVFGKIYPRPYNIECYNCGMPLEKSYIEMRVEDYTFFGIDVDEEKYVSKDEIKKSKVEVEKEDYNDYFSSMEDKDG